MSLAELCHDVLILIVQYLDAPSIRNLRSISRAMNQFCLPQFASQFETISIILHRDSLKEFVALSQNQKYNSMVKNINILITWFTNEEDIALLGYMSTDIDATIHRHYVLDQDEFIASGQDLILLAAGFQGFPKCQNVRIGEAGSRNPLGANAVPKEVFRRPPMSFDGRLAYTVATVLSSLCQSGAFRGMEMFDVLASPDQGANHVPNEYEEEWMPLDGMGGVDGLNLHELDRLAGGLERLEPAFASFRSMKLRLGGYWRGRTPREFDALARVLQASSRLERLDLRFDTSASPLIGPLLAIDPLHLSEIRLSGLHTNRRELGAVLEMHQPSLRRLTMCHVSLTGGSCQIATENWKLLLGSIAKLDLQSIQLHCLTSSPDTWFWFGVNLGGGVGKDHFVVFNNDVKENLMLLIERLFCSEVAGVSFTTCVSPADDLCFLN